MTLTPEQIVKIKQYITMYDSTMLTNPSLDFAIQDSADSLSSSFFGSRYEKAIALDVMHNLLVAKQTTGSGAGTSSESSGGTIIQKTIGAITIKWASPSSSSSSKYFEFYKTTKFGLMLTDLIKSSGCGYGIAVTEAWRLM